MSLNCIYRRGREGADISLEIETKHVSNTPQLERRREGADISLEIETNIEEDRQEAEILGREGADISLEIETHKGRKP